MSALAPGDKVQRSPVGEGVITGFTEVGYPQVNYVAVGWLETVDYRRFDPNHVGPWTKPAPKFTVIDGGKK